MVPLQVRNSAEIDQLFRESTDCGKKAFSEVWTCLVRRAHVIAWSRVVTFAM